MLLRARRETGSRGSPPMHFIRADAARSPFRERRWVEVVALGNLLGYCGDLPAPTLRSITSLVGEGGRLLLEIVPGHGERPEPLTRLPPAQLGRELRTRPASMFGRVRGGRFLPVASAPVRGGTFRRIRVDELERWLPSPGWRIREAIAVAPGFGFNPEPLEAIRTDRAAWERLLRFEEELGRVPARWPGAAALLVALERAGPTDP